MLIESETLAGWPLKKRLCDGISIYGQHLLLFPQPTATKFMFIQIKLIVSTARNEDLRQCNVSY